MLSQPGGVSTGSVRDNIHVVSRADSETKGTVTTVRRAGKITGRLTSFATDPVVTPRPHFRQFGPRQLNSAVLLPSWHDGAQPLPVLCDPYGGPHAQRVLQTSNAHAVSQWFAELGYAVLVADGRGTPGRGPQFERTVFGNLADPVLDDQIDALDAANVEFPFLDLGRVGIRGWSFGGYLAALAVLRRPDRFHAALAGAPVTTWELYDTHYTERYLGRPATNPEAYEASDLLRLPAQWNHENTVPPLMLIHGLADDNVVAAHTLRLSSALLAAGLPHEVLPLTGVTHMTLQEVVAENLLRLQADFLARALRPTPPTPIVPSPHHRTAANGTTASHPRPTRLDRRTRRMGQRGATHREGSGYSSQPRILLRHDRHRHGDGELRHRTSDAR
ncbi:MAG: S9 family peptidase [Acidimicrobiales bacterium]